MMPASPAPKLTFGERCTVSMLRGTMPLLELLGGAPYPSGSVIEHRYGQLPSEVLDLIPAASSAVQRAPVVHFHGGGWVSGNKGRLYSKSLLNLAQAGHTVFSLDYPLAPEHPHPQALRSLLRGLAWIKREHKAPRVHLIGDSSGGNLAMMAGILIANPTLLVAFDGIDPATLPDVCSITSLYGVLDRASWIEDGFPLARTYLSAYAGRTALASSPDHPVTPMDFPVIQRLPPTFIVSGSKDKLARSSKICAERLLRDFPDVQHKVYQGANHGFFSLGRQRMELCQDILRFLASISPPG